MSAKTYLAIIDRRPGEAWSIVFPNFPGVQSMAEHASDIIPNAKEALALMIEAMGDDPLPPAVEDGVMPDYDRAAFHDPRAMLVQAETASKAVRLNISLDESLLARVDDAARRAGTSRSALLAKGARLVLAGH
jgi:predicted RNase H-like HicB family nuclease